MLTRESLNRYRFLHKDKSCLRAKRVCPGVCFTVAAGQLLLPASSYVGTKQRKPGNERKSLRRKPRQEPGQLPAADAADPARARRLRLSGPHRHHPRQAAARATRKFYERAAQARRPRWRRHGIGPGDTGRGDAGEHAADAGGALRRAHDGRPCCCTLQHAARCGDPRVPARSRQRQGADYRPGVLGLVEGRSAAREGEADRHRLRRSDEFPQTAPMAGSRRSDYERSSRAAIRISTGAGPHDEWERDLAQLHVRHRRQSEGRRLSSPRRGADVLRE